MICCFGNQLLRLPWRRWKVRLMALDSLSPVSWSPRTPKTALLSFAPLVLRVSGQESHDSCSWILTDMWPVMFPDETSGSDEETLHYYIPASDPNLQSRKKKKPKAQSKTSQSLFSVIVSVSHGLIALQTNAMVNANWFIQLVPLWNVLWMDEI